MKDLIERQEAIDAVAEFLYYSNNWDGMRANFDLSDWKWKVEGVLSDLPSAEPEIVRCKECKHRVIENDVWTCPFGLPGGPEFFCGYGAERRHDG